MRQFKKEVKNTQYYIKQILLGNHLFLVMSPLVNWPASIRSKSMLVMLNKHYRGRDVKLIYFILLWAISFYFKNSVTTAHFLTKIIQIVDKSFIILFKY